jgi:8-oxo-dGTP pyrophosphatase MutT (NUDIX family)
MSENKKEFRVPDFWYRQSGVIPYRIKNDMLQILLITSRKKKRWIIPKGIVENGLKPYESAGKEALEEAGVVGIVGKESIGKYKYKKWGGTVKIKIYPMRVKSLLDDWDEIDYRKRRWFSFNEAKETIEIEKIKVILDNFKTVLNLKIE